MEEYVGKNVTFLCTSKCNTECEHCYICYKGERDPYELLNIVKSLKNKYRIMLNGAEVLTNPDYLKSYKEISQPWILSNGIALLNTDIINLLRCNNIKSVSISYHFGIQDEISKIKLETLKKIIENVKSNKMEYRILTTITSENYKLINYMCEEAYNMGARGIMFTNFIMQGNGIKLGKDLVLTSEMLKDFFNYIKSAREKYSKDDLIIERSGTFGKNVVDNSNNNFCCEFGTDRVYVTPDNNVYPCLFMTKPGYEIGKFINGRVMINEHIQHDHNVCIAKEVCNNGKQLKKLLK